jgi:hypothetical protein
MEAAKHPAAMWALGMPKVEQGGEVASLLLTPVSLQAKLVALALQYLSTAQILSHLGGVTVGPFVKRSSAGWAWKCNDASELERLPVLEQIWSFCVSRCEPALPLVLAFADFGGRNLLDESGTHIAPPASFAALKATATIPVSTTEEVAEFRRQEQQRFETPDKAYIYEAVFCCVMFPVY